MICLITGRQGEGKTSRVKHLIHLLMRNFIQVGGILSEGTWKNGQREGFHVIDIENGAAVPLCDRHDSGDDVPFRHFFFKREGMAHGLKAMAKVHHTHPEVLVIDEVGALELSGQGWSPFLDTLLPGYAGMVVMVVRESLLEQVRSRWQLAASEVFHINEWPPERMSRRIVAQLQATGKRPFEPITGIILAGGKSSRLGMDKGWVEFRGKSLMEIAIGRFRKLCDYVLISSNSPAYGEFGCPVIPDRVKDRGPMMGIYSCLEQSPHSVNLVASVDTPMVPAGLYREMIRMMNDEQVIVPDHGQQHYEPLIGLYRREIVPLMETFFEHQNFTLPDLFKQVRFRTLPVGEEHPFSNPYIFTNINAPADLELLDRLNAG